MAASIGEMAMDTGDRALLADADQQLLEREEEIVRLREDVDRFRAAYLDAERRLSEIRASRVFRVASWWWRLRPRLRPR